MNLKALGLRFALGYLMSRSSGSSQEDAAVDSLLGSTIAQAKEDITEVEPEVIDLTSAIISDLVAGRRTKVTGVVAPNQNLDENEVKAMKESIMDSSVGLTKSEVEQEIEELQKGISESVRTLSRLQRLQAGVIRRS